MPPSRTKHRPIIIYYCRNTGVVATPKIRPVICAIIAFIATKITDYLGESFPHAVSGLRFLLFASFIKSAVQSSAL